MKRKKMIVADQDGFLGRMGLHNLGGHLKEPTEETEQEKQPMKLWKKILLAISVWVGMALLLWYGLLAGIPLDEDAIFGIGRQWYLFSSMIIVTIFVGMTFIPPFEEEEESLKSSEEYLQSIDKKLDKILEAHGGVN